MIFRFVKHKDIDKQKWNACNDSACNGHTFFYSWYLDSVFANWDALILNDYEAIFPLTPKKKIGISYLLNPIFAPQLGLVCMNEQIHDSLLEKCIQYVYKHYTIVHFGIQNTIKELSNTSTKSFQCINLNQSYEDIKKSYNENLKRNLKKAARENLQTSTTTNEKPLLELFHQQKAETLKELTNDSFTALQKLLQAIVHTNKGFIYEVRNENELLATACFSHSHNRIIYIKGSVSESGKKTGAMHFLMDKVIQQFANTNTIFNFGGSSIEAVARFNKGFGASDFQYTMLSANKLPAPLRKIISKKLK